MRHLDLVGICLLQGFIHFFANADMMLFALHVWVLPKRQSCRPTAVSFPRWFSVREHGTA
ncbi:hypothetical protein [Sodalis sp.]|uniref:hypothetical protein n=1 Tax=Sodalis sp. (in: enterobacteria) TaxID=1898979 RepID=UPI0038733905